MGVDAIVASTATESSALFDDPIGFFTRFQLGHMPKADVVHDQIMIGSVDGRTPPIHATVKAWPLQ
ncbi:hypothetical protein D3C81_2068860 [compost metagenome]